MFKTQESIKNFWKQCASALLTFSTTLSEQNIQKLIEFSKFHNDFIKERKLSLRERFLFEEIEKFQIKHPGIKFDEFDDVINLSTFAAHGTNAWTLFSAFAFTNAQLLPRNEMKIRGIPVVAGELIHKKSRKKSNFSYPNVESQNFVSTVALDKTSSSLEDPFSYASNATCYYQCKYEGLMKKHLKKYEKRGMNEVFFTEVNKLLSNKQMEKAYERLSKIPVITLGCGIGKSRIDSNIENEHVYKRFNIRVIILYEKDKENIHNILSQVNPLLAKNICYLTREEINDFEDKREKVSGSDEYKNNFMQDFLEKFEKKLNLNFSDQFIENKTRSKEPTKHEIGGEYDKRTYTIHYYTNPHSSISNSGITYNTDYKLAFSEEIILNDYFIEQIDAINTEFNIQKKNDLIAQLTLKLQEKRKNCYPDDYTFSYAVKNDLGPIVKVLLDNYVGEISYDSIFSALKDSDKSRKDASSKVISSHLISSNTLLHYINKIKKENSDYLGEDVFMNIKFIFNFFSQHKIFIDHNMINKLKDITSDDKDIKSYLEKFECTRQHKAQKQPLITSRSVIVATSLFILFRPWAIQFLISYIANSITTNTTDLGEIGRNFSSGVTISKHYDINNQKYKEL